MEPSDPRAVCPDWETVRLIGRGSYGAVYEIQRELFGTTERAALKHIVIPPDQGMVDELRSAGYDEQGITAHFDDYLKDIVREYKLMAGMKGHSNIVDCDDICFKKQETGVGWEIFIRMELLTPLMKALDSVSTEEEIRKLGEDLARALVLCRSRNILHRDIKPQNIFLARDGNFKLGDFGVAKTAEKTRGGTVIGTFSYMAPEVYNNRPYGHQADLYSLGMVLYWLLNERRLPFYPKPPNKPTPRELEQARTRRFQGEPLPRPEHGSDAMWQVVRKACAYDTMERYHTAEELLADLEALKKDAGPTQQTVEEQERRLEMERFFRQQRVYTADGEINNGVYYKRKKPWRKLFILIGIGAAAILLAAALILMLGRGSRDKGTERDGGKAEDTLILQRPIPSAAPVPTAGQPSPSPAATPQAAAEPSPTPTPSPAPTPTSRP